MTSAGPPGVRPNDDIDGATRAHRRLLQTLSELDADAPRRPSLLPGWTVGHLLTHLARNADSHVGLLVAAGEGGVGDQYPGGTRQREDDIAAGAERDLRALVADVLAASTRLEAVWWQTPAHAWEQGRARSTHEQWPITELPFRRWREVEIHHADLGNRFGWADWSDRYVERELALAVDGLGERLAGNVAVVLEANDTGERWAVPPGAPSPVLVRASRRELLAWLVGRRKDPSAPALPTQPNW